MIIPDEIIRSNRKTLKVTVDSLGKVTVCAPKNCDEERIFAFLKAKERWILRHKTKAESFCVRLPSENLEGYVFLLLGREHTLVLTESRFVRLDASSRTIFLPRKNARERLVKWLKENALRIFSEVVQAQATRMQTRFSSVRVSSARATWGTCTHDNKISFSFRLLYAPKAVIEYVAVHELAHTLHKNHSREFWRTVERYVPDYKNKRKWLKDRGFLMRIF